MLKSQVRRKEVVENYHRVLSDTGYFVGSRLDENWLADSELFHLKTWEKIFRRFYFSMFSEDCLMKKYLENDRILLPDVTIHKESCKDYRSMCIIASKNKKIEWMEIKEISKKFFEASFTWIVHPQYDATSEKNDMAIYRKNKERVVFSGHLSELRSFQENVMPNEVEIPASALEKDGRSLRHDFEGIIDLIRLGVANIRIKGLISE